jgi:UPF0716 protein FxsA
MPLSFKLATALIMLAFPLVEIALLIKAGRAIGLWGVLALILVTGAAGVFVIRTAGLTALQKLFSEFESGGSPVRSMLDQGLKFTGGVLLLLPGLLGDCIGVLLLVPPLRRVLTRSAGTLWATDTMTETGRPPNPFGGDPPAGRPDGGARGPAPRREAPSTITIIEGEYERIDEDKPAPRRADKSS